MRSLFKAIILTELHARTSSLEGRLFEKARLRQECQASSVSVKRFLASYWTASRISGLDQQRR